MNNQLKPIKSNTLEKFLFDDCHICEAMKRADANGRPLTLLELKKAFKKANQQMIIKQKTPDPILYEKRR